MKKVFLSLIVFASFAFADYLYQPSNICIKSFYFKNGSIYYVVSSSGSTMTATTKNLGDDIFPDYEYNVTSAECKKTPSNNTLGLSNPDFQYLNSIIGLLIFVMMLVSLL